MNIFNELKLEIEKCVNKLYPDENFAPYVGVEIPKDRLNGDLSTNVAMVIASKKNSNPREVGLKIKESLSGLPYAAHIEVAGPGFVNFTVKAYKWHESIKNILAGDKSFFEPDVGKGAKINLEYVSANPTGPMHIGHARGAVFGDALAEILGRAGYRVVKEYYINDAGSQIDDLTKALFLRYKEIVTGEKIDMPEGLYPGEYLIETAKKLFELHKDSLMEKSEGEKDAVIREFALDSMMGLVKKDLADLGVKHDIFFSERSLQDSGSIDKIVAELEKTGLVYKGILPPPKGKVQEKAEEKENLLFKSTEFGDDMDRPLKKSDGSWAYFASDIAYAEDKIKRGFDELVFVLGEDHIGYVKRIEAIVKALGGGKVGCSVKICRLVNFVENGKPVKMSKRAGTFAKVSDVTEELGPDIIRFTMLTRKNDAPLDFDLEKAKEQSSENPVFYVQYAFVRTKSILERAKDMAPAAYEKFGSSDFDLSLLSSEEEINLIKLLSFYPKIIESAAKNFEPHRLAFYLINLASEFHSLWNLGKEKSEYKFISEENSELTAARLALSGAVGKVISRGLLSLGVKPMDKM